MIAVRSWTKKNRQFLFTLSTIDDCDDYTNDCHEFFGKKYILSHISVSICQELPYSVIFLMLSLAPANYIPYSENDIRRGSMIDLKG